MGQAGAVTAGVRLVQWQAVLGFPVQKEAACAPNMVVSRGQGSSGCLGEAELLRMKEGIWPVPGCLWPPH